MIALIYVITELVNLLISVLLMFMFIRMIISFFPMDEDSMAAHFIFAATEPVILPIRALFSHFGLFEDVPIDVPFFAATLLLTLLSYMLP